MNETHKILSDTGKYFAATTGASLIYMAQSVYLANSFGPAVFGIWNLLMIMFSYNLHAHLGLIHGMGKEIPTLRGRDQWEQARVMEESSFTAICLVGLVVSGGVFAASYLDWGQAGVGEPLKILALVMLLNQVNLFQISVLRNDKRFGILGIAVFLLPLLTFILVLLGAWAWAATPSTVLWAMLAGHLLTVGYLFWRGGYRYRPNWDWPVLKRLFYIGAPLIALNLVFSLFRTADRWVIADLTDTDSLGYYAVGMLIVGFLYSLPATLASVLYPRMLESYGRAGVVSDSGRFANKPTVLVGYLMAWVTAAAIIATPGVIHHLLPAYLPGLSAIIVLIAGSFFLTTGSVFSNFLISIDRQNVLLWIRVAALLLLLGVDYLLLKAGFSIMSVALGTSFAYFLYGLTVFLLGFKAALGHMADALRSITSVYLYYAAGCGICFLLSLWSPVDGASLLVDTGLVAVQILLMTALLAALLPLVGRYAGIWDDILKLLPTGLRG